jgi:hypothetical protein
MIDFASVFDADFSTGTLRWRAPPKNHAEKLGMVAGYPLKAPPGKKSYWQVRAFGQTFKRSRVVFYMAHGRWPEPAVDHINGQSLDDRLANLRECTLSQNAANSRDKLRTTGLPRGVYETRQGRFMARLTVNRQTASLGTFDTPEAARAVYDHARKEAFGDFA